MNIGVIELLIKQKIGLDANIIGSQNIARAINNRRLHCNNCSLDDYWQLLRTSEQEFNQLIEKLVIPETWFFRDTQPFELLKNHARSVWLNNLKYTKIKGLSIPCSTGEEPYSIVISLLEAGLSPYQFKIEAIDLSYQAITKAKQGSYSKNSFRGELPIEKKRYFEHTSQGEQINELVRQAVNFRQGNILNLFTNGQIKYDFIFCRNLLIYLDVAAGTQVVNLLERLLQPEGLLFVGASETAKITGNQWQSLNKPFTFAYRKLSPTHFTPLPPPISPPHPLTPSPPSQTKRLDLKLTMARQLGDEGKIEQALEQCSQYIETHPTSAEAYALLGTLYESKGDNKQAEQYFRRSLYLDPHCYEALVHLALLKENSGDKSGASLLRRRIEKLDTQAKK